MIVWSMVMELVPNITLRLQLWSSISEDVILGTGDACVFGDVNLFSFDSIRWINPRYALN